MGILNRFKNTNLIIYILFVVVGMFIVNNNLFNGQAGFSIFEFSMFFALFILLLASFLFIGRKYFKYRLWFTLPLLVIFIVSVVMILTMPSPQELNVLGLHGEYWDVHFEIDGFYRYQSICRFFIVLSIAYSSFILLPQLLDSKNKIVVITALISIVCFALVIQSLIFEFNNYVVFVKSLLADDLDAMYLASPKSLFPNKNCFAFVLFLGIISILLMHHYKRYLANYIMLPIIFIFILFTNCKTIIILSVAIIAFYVIYRLIVTFKEHKKRNIITISILGSIALTIVVTVFAFTPLRELLFTLFFNIGGRTIEVRNYVWSNVSIVLGILGLFLGRGFGTFDSLLQVYNYADPGGGEAYVDNAHNGYLELIGQGGIFFLILAIAFEIYFIYKCIRQIKKNQELALLSLALLIALHVYMFFEAMTPVFSYALDHLCMNVLLFIPILSLDYEEQYEVVKSEKPIKKSLLLILFSIISITLFSILFASKTLWMNINASIAFNVLAISFTVIYLAICVYLFIKNKSSLFYIAELTGMLVIICPIFAVISTNLYSPLLLAIAPITSIAVFLLINGLIKKLPLSNAYDEIYEYIDYSLNNAFLKVRSE